MVCRILTPCMCTTCNDLNWIFSITISSIYSFTVRWNLQYHHFWFFIRYGITCQTAYPLIGLCYFWTSVSSCSSVFDTQQDVDIVVLGPEPFLLGSVFLNKSWPKACCRNIIASVQVVLPAQSVTLTAVTESKAVIVTNCTHPKTWMILCKVGIYTKT